MTLRQAFYRTADDLKMKKVDDHTFRNGRFTMSYDIRKDEIHFLRNGKDSGSFDNQWATFWDDDTYHYILRIKHFLEENNDGNSRQA